MKKLLLLTTTLVFLSTFFNFSPTVNAEATPAFTYIKNPTTNLRYTTTPGSKIKDFIIIKNLDPNRWIELTIKPVNFPTRWIQEEKEKITIKPNQEIKKVFTIIIPENTEIGEITGTLSMALTNYQKPENQNNEGNFSVGLGIGNLIKINIIPGEKSFVNYLTNEETNIEDDFSKEEVIEKTAYISKLYLFVQKNINIILMLIIISLLLKLALTKKHPHENQPHKKTRTQKNLKNKKKKATPQKKK